MFLYRVKQFLWSLNGKITEKDLKYIESKLNNNEIILFRKLAINEQKHCINVAMDLEKICCSKKINSYELIKVALLHDIGKIDVRLSIIDKSILVILDYLSKGRIRKFNSINKINVYYNHGEKGANILKKYGYNERFLYLIRNHHNSNIKEDEELNLIKYCDNKN